MNFSSEELEAIQNPKSKFYNGFSATSSAMMTMENDGQIMQKLDEARQIDGTIKACEVERIFREFSVEIDAWGHGKPNFVTMTELFNEDIEPVEVPSIIVDALRSAKLLGNSIQLTSQLDRSDYVKVNKVIEALGGKWNAKGKCHLFVGKNAEEVVATFLETGKLDPVEKFGFFPTPIPLGRLLVNMGNLDADSVVLEPSAGIGNLAELCAEIVPKNQITCYEIQEKNCKSLNDKGFNVEKFDFMDVEPRAIFSHVIMNPPFEKQQDIDHILHAYQFLKPGGVLCAIMSLGVTFRSNKKTTEFRSFVEKMSGKLRENDPDAFKSSGTIARTVTLYLKKSESEIVQEISSFFLNEDRLPMSETSLCKSLVARPESPGITQFGFDF